MIYLKINFSNYEETIKSTKGLLVVDFWAQWCGPCKKFAAVIDEVSKEVRDVVFAKVNIDDESELAAKNNITSIPTLLLFKDGKLVNKSVGSLSKSELLNLIDESRVL